MTEPAPAELICPKCGESLATGADACSACGARIQSPSSTTDHSAAALLQSRGVIICLMLFVALFLAFPLLWMSRRFSVAEKIFWTIVVLLETALLLWAVWLAISHFVETLRQL